jgi:hypothetical protein
MRPQYRLLSRHAAVSFFKMHPYVASGLLVGAEAEAEGPWVTVEPARRERCSGILRGHRSALVYSFF